MTKLTGLVKGQTIALDTRVPELEGKRVHVLLQPADDAQMEADQTAAWVAWVEQGPQGPIDDDGEPEFP